jgi:oxalate decarboxylase/phosphoglucose isomerase-like protein (cupin superfamily)
MLVKQPFPRHSAAAGLTDNLKKTHPKCEFFRRDGFIRPIPLLTAGQCSLVLRHFQNGSPELPKWEKGLAASDRFVFELATRPGLLAQLRLLLGENILLWGASFLTRKPDQVHPWHSDIESSSPEGGFVSVWIGIANTSRASALQMIAASHTIGKTIQQVAHENGLRRGEASAATVLNWAREIVPAAEFVQPDMADGDGLFFDGRLWHASENTRVTGTRSALLFQYAAAGRSVKMPDLQHLEWPFRYRHSRVPVLLVSGSDSTRVNYLVPPPETAMSSVLTSQFHPLDLPLLEDRAGRWRAHHLFAGATRNVSHMSAHVSVLSPGHSPHPPHAHREEEILVVLDGEAELVIAQNESEADARRERLGAGSFVYYPAFQFHTIRNATSRPITYLMFKWSGPPRETEVPLEAELVRAEQMQQVGNTSFATQRVLEGPTHYLAKVHAHVTELQAGAGYASHSDSHDVAILLLSGCVETMGRRIEPHGVVYFPAGEMHNMKNPGQTTARYLVFEFHGPLKGEETSRLDAARVRAHWQILATRLYRRSRQRLKATALWQHLRPIYKRFR